MKELLEKNNLKPLKVGEIVKGKVIGKEKGSLFLDLGPFGTGIIYGQEFLEAKDILREVKPGEIIFAKIIGQEGKNEEGYIELSISQAKKEIIWAELKEKKEKGEIISVKILKANKGGLLTEVSGIPAFLPVSQLSSTHYPRVEGGESSQILKELQKFINKELEVQILDLDPKSEKLILSEKIKETEKVKEILKNYKVGEIVEGKITGVLDFGAFLEFPAKTSTEKEPFILEGFIHISELDWQLIEDPSEIVKVGEKVKAKIINISGDKIFLSLKALKEDPWPEIEKKYKKGDIVTGKVIKLYPFGALIKINEKVQALCHISEFGSQKKMAEKLEVGREYNFQILEIRPPEHKISLKLKEKSEVTE